METTYLYILYLLFALAIIDLVVGVSNDAVNFLNSAIGSKVATVRTILIVASLGILLGATFSSGLMEIARSGVFKPAFFSFEMVMIIFMAVMLSDVLLLDVFNTLGLPTSTTVSIIFELLGAAFAVGLLYSFSQGNGFEQINSFVNFSSTGRIIGGIFLSVIIAFSIGTLIQYGARALFTFQLKKGLRKYGAVFSGIAITSITYFLIIKGLKGSSFVSDSQIKWVMTHTRDVIVINVLFWSLITWVAMRFFDINPLKVVVLLGTFALAMAFAGNDLVNFIGVAIAAWQSFKFWTASDLSASEFSMDVLNEQMVTPTYMLLSAGAVMTITLWFSAKARKVTETEVNLSRQDEGEERFRPNALSRAIVGAALQAGQAFNGLLGKQTAARLSLRWEKMEHDLEIGEDEKPAFDLLRAAMNLTLASILIAYATSQKLPLSTTYVSFMVAMGTSLADRAWGKESAVYRVAGVLNVFAGWLLTAVIAFIGAALMGVILYFTGTYGIVGLTVMVFFQLIRSHITFTRKQKEEALEKADFKSPALNVEEALEISKTTTVESLKTLEKVLILTLKSMIGDNRDVLLDTVQRMKKLKKKSEKVQSKIIKHVGNMPEVNVEVGRLYILVFDLLQDLNQSASLLVDTCSDHVLNHHGQPNRKFLDTLIETEQRLRRYLTEIEKGIENMQFNQMPAIAQHKREILGFIKIQLDDQVMQIQNGEVGNRFGGLQTRILLELRDVVAVSARIFKVYYEFSLKHSTTPTKATAVK